VIRRLFLSLTIFLIPFQLGYHFWPSFSSVLGFRLDYLSPTIYLADLAIFAYLIFSIKSVISFAINHRYWLTVSFLFILINFLVSSSPFLSVSSWGKSILYFLFLICLFQEKDLIKLVRLPLIISTLLVLYLQFCQIINQSSIGGPFYYLGERQFNLSTPNLAKIDTSFGLFLRPYSTFSHPNSLAGYLLLVLFASPLLTLPFWINLLISLGIIFTFSKMAIIALFLFPLFRRFPKPIIITSLAISLFPLLPLTLNTLSLPEFINNRFYLGNLTRQILPNHWFLGVGLNHFIPTISNYISPSNISLSALQPVHSLPLLFLSELGLIGLLFTSILFAKFQLKAFLTLLSLVFFTGSVDHYWWTLPQNRLILMLAIAIFYQKNVRKNSSN